MCKCCENEAFEDAENVCEVRGRVDERKMRRVKSKNVEINA